MIDRHPPLAARCSIAVLVAVACNREPEGRFAQEEAPAPAASGPMRFASTIDAARRPGERITTLLELTSPASGRLRAIVATVPEGGALAVEIWTFDQRNAGQVLTPIGDRVPALRLRGGDASSPALAELRVELATPGAEVHRTLGIDGADPAAVLATMAAAATVVRAPEGAAEPRLAGLATVVRGLEDGPLLEQDGLGHALDQLALGAWSPSATRTISERRAELSTSGGEILELRRHGDGWAIAALRPGP